MEVSIYAPSYKRPQKAKTQIIYPSVKLVVCESQADDYIKNGNDIVICPDSAQGNLCGVRNWILDNLFNDNDCLVLLDDDCSFIGYYNNKDQYRFKDNELIEFCEKSALLCQQLGYKFFGLNCIPDKGAYKEYMPFGFTKYIGGPFQAHLKDSPIRYDEQLSLKEDYDMTLQHIYKYGGCLRTNYAHYNVKQAEQVGGCATYRNLDEEKRQFKLLQEKWGKDIIKQDKQSKRSFDFNPILKIPINGV